MTQNPRDEIVYVSKSELRPKFNDGGLRQLIESGALRAKRLSNRDLKGPNPWQGPICTHSQYVRCLDSHGRLIVEIHRYLGPNGTLGASGKPDPKRLREGNRILAIRAG
jgi:hypothetical protein